MRMARGYPPAPDSFAPTGAETMVTSHFPTAYAVGYILAPPSGAETGEFLS